MSQKQHEDGYPNDLAGIGLSCGINMLWSRVVEQIIPVPRYQWCISFNHGDILKYSFLITKFSKKYDDLPASNLCCTDADRLAS